MFCEICGVNETDNPDQICDNCNSAKGKFIGNVSGLLKLYWKEGKVDENRLSSLALALASEPHNSCLASKALFGDLVEPLMDCFTIEGRKAYLEIFSRIILALREYSQAIKINEYLNRMGINNSEQMLIRARRVTMQTKTFDVDRKNKVKKVFVLSRVTIGADVAVTSIALERMMRELPNSEIIFIGPKAQKELFGANRRIKILEMPYSRKGNFINRLESWIDLVDLVEQNTAGISEDEYLIVDPDSRLTQLGVMPLPIASENYIFFNSSVRDIENQSDKVLSIAEVTNRWLDEVFGKSRDFLYPRVWPEEEDKAFAERFFAQPALKGKPSVFINLGVGGNNDKRLGIDFEKNLLVELINQDLTVVLSKGIGAEEVRIQKIVDFVSNNGRKIVGANSNNIDALSAQDAKVITYGGSLGELAALISKSAYYVGYDSLGQHLAAALHVPVTTIMAGFINEFFRQRWTPSGEEEVNVISVDTLHLDRKQVDDERIISSVINNVLHSLHKKGK